MMLTYKAKNIVAHCTIRENKECYHKASGLHGTRKEESEGLKLLYTYNRGKQSRHQRQITTVVNPFTQISRGDTLTGEVKEGTVSKLIS